MRPEHHFGNTHTNLGRAAGRSLLFAEGLTLQRIVAEPEKYRGGLAFQAFQATYVVKAF